MRFCRKLRYFNEAFREWGQTRKKVSFVPKCQFKTIINQHLYSISTCTCILLWCPVSNSRLSDDILKATYSKKVTLYNMLNQIGTHNLTNQTFC